MKRRRVFVSLVLMAALVSAGCSGNSGPTGTSGGGGSGTGGGSSPPPNSTSYVDGVNGNDSNDCSTPQTACRTIGHAIALTAAGGSIMVAAATYSENLNITSLTIVGAGATTTTVDGGGGGTVVTTNNTVTLSGLTIQNGGRGLYAGGVQNNGTLTINDSAIIGNSAGSDIKGNSWGGGIYNSSTLMINNSVISGNAANEGTVCEKECSGFAAGGGIYNAGNLTINNTTFSGNSANSHSQPSGGGAIASTGSVSINNSTISGNSADSAGGISGAATIQNSIVANNSGGNCGGTLTSNGYNLSSDGNCNFNGAGDMNNTDPMLGPLQNNGGPTLTMALIPGSLAIDAGNPSGCTDGQGHLLKTDQRGQPRPDKEDTGGCDIGAYERQGD